CTVLVIIPDYYGVGSW
nr:immunoglobulin heavy chain junction region [Macaca mulatta]MOX14905.1 immunoglobulin heavy chain junction region [Macaca mulatta]MOX15889.1 immunoglobulin heavy chain junction region [Macaca mulatta]MOX16127.1 immunoglobulin heavy chain junction region [Macaca mulatta]MOX16228.1 immunoglobulin heavy chain junction region [Macaca mulatta]